MNARGTLGLLNNTDILKSKTVNGIGVVSKSGITTCTKANDLNIHLTTAETTKQKVLLAYNGHLCKKHQDSSDFSFMKDCKKSGF